MRSYWIYYLTAILLLSFTISCTKDKLIIEEDPCAEMVTYSEEVELIIQTNCAYSNCHDGSGAAPGNYTSYQGLVPFLNETFFESRVVNLRDMPPSYAQGPTSLSQEDIDLIKCWIVNNYAEN